MTPRLPFRYNPKVAARNAKLWRLIRAGTLQPMTKAEQRNAYATTFEMLRQQPNITATEIGERLSNSARKQA
jgi:hypothetical protein